MPSGSAVPSHRCVLQLCLLVPCRSAGLVAEVHHYMIKLLYLVISLCDLEFQDGYPNNSAQETSTQSHHSQTTLASSQRPYCFDPPAYRALPQYPCAASLGRPSTSCTSTTYPLPYLCCNGRVLEMQKMLEGAERKACTLPAEATTTTATERGTRPGSPLADLGFNLLMSKVLHSIAAGLNEIPEYLQGCLALGLHVPPLAWIDDLTVPITATKPDQLEPLIQAATSIIHMAFSQHGLTMNFDGGKTEAVVMYRGPGAAAHRTQMFDKETKPCIIVGTPSHILTLRVVASYRHLGSKFTMDADIEHEVTTRIATARQAFAEMKQPIFLNRSIPVQGRLQLYNSLVISRLLYGCAVWSDIPNALMTKLDAFLVDHQRRIANIGFWNGATMNDEDFRHHMELEPFRITWARHRLLYLRHIAVHGSDFHRQGLLMEFTYQKGWLREVVDDLVWLRSLIDLPFDFDENDIQWIPLWEAIAACPRWKSILKRACRKHVLQERIARDVKHYHNLIEEELTSHGYEIWHGEQHQPAPDLPNFGRGACERSFLTLRRHLQHMNIGFMALLPWNASTSSPRFALDV